MIEALSESLTDVVLCEELVHCACLSDSVKEANSRLAGIYLG